MLIFTQRPIPYLANGHGGLVQVAARHDPPDPAYSTLPFYLRFPWVNVSASSMNSGWDVGDSC